MSQTVKRILTLTAIALMAPATLLYAKSNPPSIKPAYVQAKELEATPIRTAGKLNLALLVGIVNPAIEFRIHKNVTLQLEAFGCFQPEGFLCTDIPVSLAASWLEGRYYIKESFKGFFAGLNAGFSVYRLSKGIAPVYWGKYPNAYQVGQNVMLGATLGYQFSFSRHWGCEVSFGGGWQLSRYEGHNSVDGSLYVGLNKSGEWLPVYKAAVNLVYKW